jgi:transcription elongation factor GreA
MDVDDARYQITREALESLEAELHELETEGRNEMAQRIRTAREWGDLKENAEYHDAKNDQRHLETKIQRLQDLRRNAVIVEATTGSKTVALGSTVKVVDEDSGKESTYSIVTATEADPVNGKLSIDSPLAHALDGAKPGDVVDFNAPRGVKRLRVAELS